MPIPTERTPAAASPVARDPYAAFRSPAYRLYTAGSFISVIGRQMLGVAVAYEVFRRTHSATALGLIGLAGALPIIFLALPAGQVADRFNRRSVIIYTQLLGTVTSLLMALVSARADAIPPWPVLAKSGALLHAIAAWCGEPNVSFGPEVPLLFALLLLNGVARTFSWAARSPFIANVVPRSALANAITWNSSLFEIASVTGPALCGMLLHGFGSFSAIYLIDAACGLVFVAFLWPVRAPQEAPAPTSGHPLRDLLMGLRFVWQTKVILATITLDLFAVLLGGATALLPIYSDQILHVGAMGLGWLRGAQSAGAIGMAIALAHARPMRHAGRALLIAVVGYGAATIVFGYSKSFWLSLLALAAAGAFDNISVVVRHTLVQILTPDAMRGRVAAVNNVFIGSSNELGAFESGLTAARFGPVLSVVGGGIGTIVIVLATALKWPEVRRIGPLSLPSAPRPGLAEEETEGTDPPSAAVS